MDGLLAMGDAMDGMGDDGHHYSSK